MIFVGDDWAEDHHDVYVMDADGDAAGVASAARRTCGYWRVPRAGGRPRRGTQPGGDRHRNRSRPVGGRRWARPDTRCMRSTRWPSPATATATRSPARNPMPATPSCWPTWSAPTGTTTALWPATAQTSRRSRSSPEAHQNLIWARTRHTNALRSALREYYPVALEAFDDLHDRDALAVLGRAPTPAEAAHLSVSKIRSALKRAGRQRNLDARAQQIAAVLRTEALAAPPRSPPHSPRPPAPRSASSSS